MPRTALQRFLNARNRVSQALRLGEAGPPDPEKLNAAANFAHALADLLESDVRKAEKAERRRRAFEDDDEVPA